MARLQKPEDSLDLPAFFRATADGDVARVTEVLAAFPRLAAEPALTGASRREAAPFYLERIGHYIYAGDTALHVAAAAYRAEIARDLIARGAAVNARNRMGAEPLHYACDGSRDQSDGTQRRRRRPLSACWQLERIRMLSIATASPLCIAPCEPAAPRPRVCCSITARALGKSTAVDLRRCTSLIGRRAEAGVGVSKRANSRRRLFDCLSRMVRAHHDLARPRISRRFL